MKQKAREVGWNNTAVLPASIIFTVAYKAGMYGDTTTHQTWIYGYVHGTHACSQQNKSPQKTDAFDMQPLKGNSLLSVAQ